MRRLMPALALALLVSACFGGSAARRPVTALRIVYSRDVMRGTKPAVVHSRPLTLACDPPSGDLRDPAAACHALLAHPATFVGRPRSACIGPILRWSVHISGALRGRRISRTYDMCAYPQAHAWTHLGGTKLIGVVPQAR
jgi:hypothetical protein